VQLDLFKNHLDGAIPDDPASFKKLCILDVSENNLTGTIPRSLFSMLNLQTLNVTFNNLSEVIPNEGNGAKCVTVNLIHWKSVLAFRRFMRHQFICRRLGVQGGQESNMDCGCGVFGDVAVVLTANSTSRHQVQQHFGGLGV